MPLARPATAVLLALAIGSTTAPAREDPLEVSPQHYRLRAGNPSFRALEFTLAPGESDAFHGHPDGVYHVLDGGRVRLHSAGGEAREVELRAGLVGFQPAVEAHRVENVGHTTVRVLMVELLHTDDAGETMGPTLDRACETEVEQLHRFFEDWFHGRLAVEQFTRLEEALADGFTFVSTEGELLDRPTLIGNVRNGRGRWRGDEEARIWIENPRVLHREGQTLTVVYEEWQHHQGRTRGRLSTVVFRRAEDRPHGLEWLHVHEVWLPDDVKPKGDR